MLGLQWLRKLGRQNEGLSKVLQLKNDQIAQLKKQLRAATQRADVAEYAAAHTRRQLQNLMGVPIEPAHAACEVGIVSVKPGVPLFALAPPPSIEDVAGEALAMNEENRLLRAQIQHLQAMLRWRREPSRN